MRYKLLPVAGLLLCGAVSAQTFTMGKKCKEQNSLATALLKDRKYQEALDAFTAMTKSCNTKDAREATATGKAEALNGLGKYEEAIAASNAALKVTKNKSLMAFFQKAVAQNKLKQYDASRATFSKMIELTEKNENTKARASNYAILSLAHWRQSGNMDSADYFLQKAMELDPGNAGFLVQKGDMMMADKKYNEAFDEYDKAVALGKADLEMYMIRSNARMKIVQDKYHTTNAQELREKMSASEKEQLCTELKKAISLGLQDMKQDMFASLVCK